MEFYRLQYYVILFTNKLDICYDFYLCEYEWEVIMFGN